MKNDKDIDKYEEKENKPTEPIIQSVLIGISVPELDISNADSIGDAIDNLGSHILACTWKLAERTMANQKISADDEYKIVQLHKLFKVIEAAYKSMVKMGRISGGNVNASEASDKNFLHKIKMQTTTIGSIEVSIPK